jgi:hypothetical protein
VLDPLVITGLAAASGSVLGALGMLLKDRRTGRLGMHDQQRVYINDQQADINALRAHVAEVWTWIFKTLRRAAAAGLELDPLPGTPPEPVNTSGKDGEP